MHALVYIMYRFIVRPCIYTCRSWVKGHGASSAGGSVGKRDRTSEIGRIPLKSGYLDSLLNLVIENKSTKPCKYVFIDNREGGGIGNA